ncbi:MAG TPA: hypothetical protein ENH12_01310 [Proteobacteria bacterium]|nr:hypothetical protein [Pseudomonadota bacterium]
MKTPNKQKNRWIVYLNSPSRSADRLDRFLEILESYTPWVEYRRGRTAYLEFEEGRGEEDHPLEIIGRLRKDLDGLGIPVSFGIGSTKLLARAAAGLTDPGESLWILPQGEEDLIQGLSVELWPGLYPKTISQLLHLGIRRVGELARIDPFWVKRVWGDRGLVMREQARGFDPRPVTRRVPSLELTPLLPQPRLFPPQGKTEKLKVLSHLAAFLRDKYGETAAKYSLE